MAYSPAKTDSSSDLYAPSEHTVEHEPSWSIEQEPPQGSTAPSMPFPNIQLASPSRTASDGSTNNDGFGQGREESSGSQANTSLKRKREQDPKSTYTVPSDSEVPEPHPLKEYTTGHEATARRGVRPLDAESIWAASRKRFAPGLPRPLRNLKELDMWRLLRGQACQLCNNTKGYIATDIDLLLSSDFPSFLRFALPFALVSKSMNYIPNALLRESTVPPSLDLFKRFYKPHVQQIRQRLDDVQELGTASADEWSKGLGEEGKERMNEVLRWEQWEAKGGLKKVNARPPVKAAAPMAVPAAMPNLPPKPPSTVDVEALAAQQVPVDPRYNGQNSDGFVLPAEQYQYPYGSAASYQSTWMSPNQFQELPAHNPPPSIPIPRPERNMKSANEAKAARRAEIERRCSLLDPPLPANILKHMDSFQAAIQISTPFTELAWDTLKPRLLAQRANAEKREQELVQQNELLQSENRQQQRRHQEVQSKDTRDTADRRWDRAQAPVHDILSALADAYIDEKWHGGRAVNKENSPKFAADVLLTVRQRYYERFALTNAAANTPTQNGSTSGPQAPMLFLDNMKWVFDTKIKPFTENFQRELFLCNGCDDNFKFYGFEGVIQHYAAKHTSSLSQGSIVVYWRAEWPDEPPFNPDPSLSKSAYYKLPSPASAGFNSYSQIDRQVLGPDDRHSTAAGSEPQQTTDGYSTFQTTMAHNSTQATSYHDTTNHYPYDGGYSIPSSTAPTNGVQIGFVSTQPPNHVQEWQGNSASTAPVQSGVAQTIGPQYNGYNYPGAFNTQETAAVSSYGSQGPLRATAPHPPHFDPSRNNIAQLTESYQQQMDEMAKQSRDVWFATQGVKDLPASVRIYVVIHHMASRCSAKFTTVPSLAMFLDGIDNNAQMRPVRSLNGLACKICVMQHNATYASDPQSQPPAGDRKLFTLPHLLNHFRNAHLDGSEAFANPGSGPGGPKHDWTRDMIELPEDRLISNLVYSQGMDDNKLDLIASAFPQVFPLPLPSLGYLRSSGVLRSTGPVSGVRGVPSSKHDYPLGPTDHNIIMSTYSKCRADDSMYDRPLSTFRPASELSRPSEPPGEDEYDPHKPAYQGKPHTNGAVSNRMDVFGAPDKPREQSGRHDGSYDGSIPQTTDLAKLIYEATQMQPSYEERRQPQHQGSQPDHTQTEASNPRYYNPQSIARDASVSTYGANGDRIAANGGDYANGQATIQYVSEQREGETLRNTARSPSVSAGVRAAEEFLKHFRQAPDAGKNFESGGFEQRQRPDTLDQWPGQSGMRIAESERRYQNDPTSPISYKAPQVGQDVSPGPPTHGSSPTLQGDRDTSPSHFRASGMYQHTNHQRATSNALVNLEDPEMHRPGTRTYVDHSASQGVMIQDRHRHSGYGMERPQSGLDEFRHAQDSHLQDHVRYSVPIAPTPVYYRSKSPVEDSQAQPVYRYRSPVPRKQVQRIPYGHPNQDRYEYVEERDYAHDPQIQYQRQVEYVPVRMGGQRPSDSGRYMVTQPMDLDARANYVRVDDAYDEATLYERDGQLYRADPRTYRTPIIRGDNEMAPGYSY
ncbi:MAG: hypothetical protein Q9226_001267 [Calogaya cf. arnoldii]